MERSFQIPIRTAFCILGILLFFACNVKRGDLASDINSTVWLQGSIKGATEEVITLQVSDLLAYDRPLILDTIQLDSTGSFSLSFDWNVPDNARIDLGNYYIPLYLMPDDSLHVEYDLEIDQASFAGRGAAVNQYLQDLAELDDRFILYANLPLDQYILRLDSLTAAKMDLLEALRPQATAEHAAHPFLEVAMVENEARRLKELIQYPTMFQFVTKAEKAPELPGDVQVEIENYPLSNETGARSSAYHDLLNARLSDLISDTLKQSREIYEERHYRFADSLLTGHLRELQLARVVQKVLAYGSGIEMGEVLLDRFMADHPSSRYAPYLQELYERSAKVAIGRPAPTFTAADLDGRTVTLADLRGQLVYMDIWASWCLPCRMAMPDVIQLSKDMPGSVQVVMISVDDDQEDWRRLAAENPGPLHLWVEGGFASTFASAYNLSGVPHYMLLDDEGIILQNNGPYPKEAKAKLEAALKASPDPS